MPDPPVFSAFEKAVLERLEAIQNLLERQARPLVTETPQVDHSKLLLLTHEEHKKVWQAQRAEEVRAQKGKQ